MSKNIIRMGASGKVLALHDGSSLDLEGFHKGEIHHISNALSNALGIHGKLARPPRRGPRRNKKGQTKTYGRRKEGLHH